MLPTTDNFPTCTLAAFQAAPVGYEVMFYHPHRKILPGHWAIMGKNPATGERVASIVRTDAQMVELAAEYKERGV